MGQSLPTVSAPWAVRWLALSLAVALCPAVATAHAKLVRSQPAAQAALREPPKTVELWFSEELEPTFNTIVVMDESGKRVDKNNTSVGEGNKKLQIDLEELGAGTFTVEWKALSSDQHTIRGSFTFTVEFGEPAAKPEGDVQHAGPGEHKPQEAMPPEQTGAAAGAMKEIRASWAFSVVRWLEYLSMMTLFGGFAFLLLVLRPSLGAMVGDGEQRATEAFARSARRFTQLSGISLAVLAVTALAGLVLQASAVMDISLAQAVKPSELYKVLVMTGYGGAWLLEVAAIVVLVVIITLFSRRLRKTAGASTALLWVGLGVSALLFFVPSLTGHAAAAKEYHFAVGTDWLHLVAGGVWVGGLIHLVLTLPRAMSRFEGRERLLVLTSVIPRFTRYAIMSTILIVLTGLYNTWMHVESFAALWNTAYGRTLLLKVALFLPMLALGGVNTFILNPRAKRSLQADESDNGRERSGVDRKFRRSVTVEVALGVVVLLLAAVLAFLQPARSRHDLMSRNTISRR